MIFDAHTHLQPEGYTGFKDFYQLAVASAPEECAFLERAAGEDRTLYYACGVHPWRSATVSVKELLPWFGKASAIGEIGMDRVWCQVELPIQKAVFQEQLQWADRLKKPVILHTKGCEKEVLDEISGFPHPILVHWYSSEAYLEGYLDLGCFFTVGPDLFQNPAVRNVGEKVPLEKLMVESDGIEGISWALGRAVRPEEISGILKSVIDEIAAIKGCPSKLAEEAVFENAKRFVQFSQL